MQCIAYAIYITPVFFMWEKLIGTHYKPNWIRLPSRLPVGEPLSIYCYEILHWMPLKGPASIPVLILRRMVGISLKTSRAPA